MNEIFIFTAILAFSALVRILIDRRQRQSGKPQIGWIAAVITFWLLNSIFFNFEGSNSGANSPTTIGPTEWLILVGPPLIVLGFLLYRYKLKRK